LLTKEATQQAYSMGVQKALRDAGLVKQSAMSPETLAMLKHYAMMTGGGAGIGALVGGLSDDSTAGIGALRGGAVGLGAKALGHLGGYAGSRAGESLLGLNAGDLATKDPAVRKAISEAVEKYFANDPHGLAKVTAYGLGLPIGGSLAGNIAGGIGGYQAMKRLGPQPD